VRRRRGGERGEGEYQNQKNLAARSPWLRSMRKKNGSKKRRDEMIRYGIWSTGVSHGRGGDGGEEMGGTSTREVAME
jgi:hypothetical protein